MTPTGWLILSVYVIGWLFTANRLFSSHKASPREWSDQAYRIGTAFGYGLLGLVWPLSIVYLIIRGKAVPDND